MRILKDYLLAALVLLELVLSAIFLFLSQLTGSLYFKGVGIGLVIAWVTGAVAYLIRKKMIK
jgi:hypothetical protein